MQILILSSSGLTAAPVVGIYCGKGVTAGYLWHAYPLESRKIPICFFTEKDVESLKDVDVVCFPSGGMYARHISPAGREHLKQLIREQGVGYMGTCGGNVFGCKLGLLDADLMKTNQVYSFGVPVNGYPGLKVAGQDSRRHPAMKNASDVICPFYFWGQVFRRVGADVTVLAKYTHMDNCFTFDGMPYQGESHQKMSGMPAMIAGKYGKGRVILSGPHPELGEEQLFVDWIYYLSEGRRDSKQLQKTSPASESMPGDDSRSLIRKPADADLSALKSQIRLFEKEIRPYEEKISPDYEDRWKHHITTGIPMLVIFVDTCERLRNIEKSIALLEKYFEDKQMKGLSKETLEQYVHEIRNARKEFSEMASHLAAALEILRNIRQKVSDNIECERLKTNLYSEYYPKLISGLKSVNLCLIGVGGGLVE